MEKIFATTLSEGAQAAKCDGCPDFTYTPEPEVIGMIIGALVGLAIIIGAAVLFAVCVKKKMRNKDEFSGIAWGLFNGILGIGILPTIIAHASINDEIAKVKNKKYAKYAKEEMHKFLCVYVICIAIWILISLILLAQGYK